MNDPFDTRPPVQKEVSPVHVDAGLHPEWIGRYRVERVVGQGGFGLVYLAHDEQLSRLVAIKVPHSHLVAQAADAEPYLTEARTVANLDHPHIVPVYDVGSTEQFPCFVVSKFIDGTDLATKQKQSPLGLYEAVELVATVAEALHYAHKQGLVHRDIKPGNLLLDKSGKPFVGDFGLALREQDVGKGPRYAGTPPYMSPEQARGEGHRVDGRSDIFSLGVVFYELMTGRRPFRADTQSELLEQINSVEARPPRMIDDRIPKELDRICLKALSMRSSDRYSTARDMGDDLRQFLKQTPVEGELARRASIPTTGPLSPSLVSTPVLSPQPTPAAEQVPVKIVPKGLRSFDAHDADFFLELLPGPRDREGLPDILRFWKTRIEATDPDQTFAVGLIYGPSGCGKSSLVKAGLLPRLSEQVIAVYVEATAAETETRLLYYLRKRCPELPSTLGLKETFAALRRGLGLPAGKKVLILLDQFEQWLHARRNEDSSELVPALRQCDGGRVQCLVLVRDDFWLAISRFLKELEIRLVEGENSAVVDLFDPDHARKVLAACGRAFGKLPEQANATTKAQHEFLSQAVSGLALNGKVICIRLALFAEMMKGKAWTPSTLKAAGGIEGVGMTFLEETFSAATAPPEHRYHQKAAQLVLKALLPEANTDLKGHMRSHAELLAASGYANRPKDFADLLRLLDGELRLLTPTDPEGQTEGAPGDDKQPCLPVAQSVSEVACGSEIGAQFYQLTHDYLVPSLHEWLTRKQKETRKGRAKLLLADRAVVWNARRENRQLPSLWQWLQIRARTQQKNWTPPQRKMMWTATRYHALRGFMLAMLLAAFGLMGWGLREQQQADHAKNLVEHLLKADIANVPEIIAQIEPFLTRVDPLLRKVYTQSADTSVQKLHTSLALLSVDSGQVEFLYGRLLDAKPNEVPVIRDALAPHKEKLVAKLWAVVAQPPPGKKMQRLRAACALASYDPGSPQWEKFSQQVAADLVVVNPVFLGWWSEGFRPVTGKLLEPLAAIFHDHTAEYAAERTLATNLLAEYAADQPQVLADLLLDADAKQFAVLFPVAASGPLAGAQAGPLVATFFRKELDQKLPLAAKHNAKEKLAKRQANAAVALVRLGQADKVWPLLKHSPDPRLRSYLIHRLSPLGADVQVIVQRLNEEPDVTIRRALILSLGTYRAEAWPAGLKNKVLTQMQQLYVTAEDPGLHAATEWLLRLWQEEPWLTATNAAWAKDTKQRDKKLAGIEQALRQKKAPLPPQWYVTGQGQTMVVIPEPAPFLMGSPPEEDDRYPDEPLHLKQIGRHFAIAARPVTLAEYLKFKETYSATITNVDKFAPTPGCPVLNTSWHQAAAYCNWLSKEEGIPPDEWCYVINAQELVTKMKANYLSLTGYRLPTEAEWEYACRAGAVTSRYYGESEELLGQYAWYLGNAKDRSWPVGSKKPNDLGMFDMHGNIWNWCQGVYQAYPQEEVGAASADIEDNADLFSINIQKVHVLRGGAFINRAPYVRAANRLRAPPTLRVDYFGFRPAKTLPP